MVLPGLNLPVKPLVQGQDSVTKHHLSPCHTTVLLPEHFTTKEIQAAVVCFIQTPFLLQTWKQDLWKKTLKNQTRNLSFGKAGAFPVALQGRAGARVVALSPGQASEWSECWAADCACNATSDGSLHS